MKWYNETTNLFMKRGYLRPNQTIQEKLHEMAEHSMNILGKGSDYYNRLMYHFTEANFIIPTPTWKNFYKESNETAISCFGVMIEDTVESIILKGAEVALQNKIGGGSSGSFQNVRKRGSKIGEDGFSNGSVSMMGIFQEISDTIAQPNRRGHFSATQDIEHGDADEFMEARTDGHKLQNISTGVKISDAFMNRVLAGDKEAGDKLRRLVRAKFETGFHYVFFTDTVNRNTVDVYKDKGKIINHSNMCQEIALPNSPDETFVCNLLGMNVVNFDKWKDTDAVEIGIYFMDSMLQDFLEKMERKRLENEDYYNVLYKPAVTFVKNNMAMGMGQSGFHSYLQSKMIPFDSLQGRVYNNLIAKTIYEQAYKASEKMALEYGKANILKEDKYKRRHTTLIANAPNTSSSFIPAIIVDTFEGVQSQSFEAYVSNYFVKDVAKVRKSFRNPYLQKLLEELGKNTEDVWLSILKNDGSVQHLDFLTQEQKDVFKTFIEIPQMTILELASMRQLWVDQSQSLNLMVGSDTTPDEVIYWILKAWKMEIKNLYYQLNVSSVQQFTNDRAKNECTSCSG